MLSLAAAAIVLTGPQGSAARDLVWESPVPEFDEGVPQYVLQDATGTALGGQFSFELGTFDQAFVPTVANMHEWATYWKVLDRAFDPTPAEPGSGDEVGWFSDVGLYSRTVTFETDGTITADGVERDTVFVQGETVYVWVLNQKTRDGDTEWALVTKSYDPENPDSNWVIPDPQSTDETAYVFSLSDANVAIYGNLGNPQGPEGYLLQTGVVPVPEPGAVCLLGLTAVGTLLLRRRRAADARFIP